LEVPTADKLFGILEDVQNLQIMSSRHGKRKKQTNLTLLGPRNGIV
jgi:hypothetical protein